MGLLDLHSDIRIAGESAEQPSPLNPDLLLSSSNPGTLQIWIPSWL